MQELAAAAVTQAETLDQVNGAVSEMDRMTQQNAAMAEQSNAASRTLAVEADALSTQIKKFRVTMSVAKVRDAAKGKTGFRARAA
jgi:methyl-accepting chemotaxis protein